MNTEDLERLIEGQSEGPALDFKAPGPWDFKKLTKDILAMSNLPDGGHIVVGVEEQGNAFVNVGVSEHDCKTYKLDEMKDQVAKYADPMADFTVFLLKDSLGLQYVVIRVFSFRETPVLCKKTLDGELRATTLYYRNTNRRPESAPVSNINDLRDIIELAAVRLMQRRRSFGYIVPSGNDENYQEEIALVDKVALARIIKSEGYCEVSVTPLQLANLSSLNRCKEVVEKAQVNLAWALPIVPRNSFEGNLDTAENCYQGTSDIGARREFWRMHLSEHFYLLNAFVEDWLEGDQLRGHMAKKFPRGKYLFYFTSIVHYLTQVFTFIERLAIEGLYKDGARISITFHKTAGRKLHLDSDYHTPLMQERITQADKISITEQYSRQELLEGGAQLSNPVILKVLEYFKFSPPKDALLQQQEDYLKRR